MCTHKHSQALMSMGLWGHECWSASMAPRRHAHTYSWALMNAHCSMAWVFMATNDCSWVIMNIYEHPLALMITHKYKRVGMTAPDYESALMSTHGHSWAWRHWALSTHGISRAVMSMVSLGHRLSSALMSIHGIIAPYSWVLVSAHEHI